MELVAAAGDLLTTILDSSYLLWGEGLSRKAYENYNIAQQGTRWGQQHLDRVALVDRGHLLSSAKRYRVELSIDGQARRALGIAAVFTPPELRGRGHAGELLEMIVDGAASDGCDFAMLFSEIGTDYYARHSFSLVRQDTFCLEVERKGGAPAVVVRGGCPRDVLPVANMHRELAARYRFSFVRTPDWIEYAISKKRLLAGLAPDGTNGVLFYIVEEGGRAVAYVVVTTSPRGWTLEECGDRDPSGARVGALLQTLIAREPSVGMSPLYGWLPPGWLPPQVRIVSRAAATQVMMLRPLNEAARSVTPFSPSDVLYWHADAF